MRGTTGKQVSRDFYLFVLSTKRHRFGVKLISSAIYPKDATGMPVFNPWGKYIVKLWWNGIPRAVVVDDYLPAGDSNCMLCCSSTNKSELWPSIIEKAYMKLRDGYTDGNTCDDSYTLFGWIPQTYHRPVDDPDLLWTRLMQGFSNGSCMMTLATSEVDPSEGLVPRHAYACLDVLTVDGKRLLKLKNPWSSGRWQGKFSENDFDSWTPTLQHACSYDLESQLLFDNGVFWMSWEDVLVQFESLFTSWSTAEYPQKIIFHGKIEKYKEVDDLHVGESSTFFTEDQQMFYKNPNFAVQVQVSYVVELWLQVDFHQIGTTTDAAAVYVFRNGGSRVYFSDQNLYAKSNYTQNSHVALVLLLQPGDFVFTVVICHAKISISRGFTFQVFSPVPVTVRPIAAEVDPFVQSLTGVWDRLTSTRQIASRQDPMFLLSLPAPTAVHLRLETPVRAIVHITIADCGGRRLWDSDDDGALLGVSEWRSQLAVIEVRASASKACPFSLRSPLPRATSTSAICTTSARECWSSASRACGLPSHSAARSSRCACQ
eukprot:TRINITY_DN1242_c0_g1_i6.p1 TRINITY_DN1242_c0_g1~~TRINITY_DN1242_c0_g1_i6.p1  ORF type:complete len:543 (+),score=49.65 TRINITY_DN1242_c0_g1_i6:396-2024(+)